MPDSRRKTCGAILAAAVLALGGCASVSQATPERDAEAKRFQVRPDAAAIYVYRNDFAPVEPASDNTVLYVGERLIGGTLPGTFFRVEVPAGEHVLHGIGHDQGTLKLDTRPETLYFVSLQATSGNSRFVLVKPEIGKRDILRCCALLENWKEGQRTLLR
jgi:hypothetical protein